MAAPHVTGAAVLLIDYSRQNGEQWSANEIKVRLMNNAYSFGEDSPQDIGVFHAGAGYVDVYAAAKADTAVSVSYDRVVYGNIRQGPPFAQATLTTTQTGSFSFNSVGTLGQANQLTLLSTPSPNVRTLSASITNESNSVRTYTIDYEFTNNPGNAMTLTFCQRSIRVAAGETVDFSATATARGNVAAGFYQGHIFVREGNTLVARLPFALVGESAVQVSASELNFNLGEGQTAPASIDRINVLHGTNITDFLNSYHNGFPENGPANERYVFEGWYLDAGFTRPLTTGTVMPAANTTLHAKWAICTNIQIATGESHSLVIREDGSLWTWGQNAGSADGRNADGRLGVGDANDRDIPTRVLDENVSGVRWIAASGGRNFSVAIRDDGTLWSWGRNNEGQLGLGSADNIPRLAPTEVPTAGISGDRWTSVSAGFYYALAIRDDGTLWSWGRNSNGSLGLGDSTRRTSPIKVSVAGVDEWKMVAAGTSYSLAICSDGTLWSWGQNAQGRLGLGDTLSRNTPTKVSTTGISGNRWIHAEADWSHSLAIRCDGTLWAFGNNHGGQLGTGGSTVHHALRPTLVSTTNVSGDRWSDITAGHVHTLGIRDDGILWSWGSSLATGLGDRFVRGVPTKPSPPEGSGNRWIAVETGISHTIALCSDNILWAWGAGSRGELGIGERNGRPSPTEVLMP